MTPTGVISWGEWHRRIENGVGRLHAVAPRGGVVAFLADDPLDAAALVLASLRAGVTVAPLSPRLPAPARVEVAGRLRAVMVDSGASADPLALPAGLRSSGGVVVHTSGSTGEPRAAFLPGEVLVAGALGLVEAFDLHPGDTWLLGLPLHHVAGLGVVVRCALAGGAFAVPDPAWTTYRAVQQLGATHASLVGTQLFRLLRDGEGPVPAQLRLLLLGGGPVSPALLNDAAARGWPVANSYGLTEMGSTVTATRAGAVEGSAGEALPGRTVRVVDDQIHVGGEPLFAGYLSDGSLDRPVDSRDLFATGDLGSIDAEGRLTITGRADNLFISGGENVQPEEVETALASLPGVVRAVVVPVPDAEFGCRGVAFVELADGSSPGGHNFGDALAERLERYKIPVRYLAWPAGEEGFKPSRREFERKARTAIGDE